MNYLVLTLLITFTGYKLLKFLAKIFRFIYQFNMDQISELSELVLSCILSKLTMKDVVKIGIQSRRWVNIRLLRTDLNFDVHNMFHNINEMPKFKLFSICIWKQQKSWKTPHLTMKCQTSSLGCLTFHCQMGAFPIFVVSKHKLKIAEFQQMLWNIIGTSKFRSVLNNQIFNHLFDCMPILTTSFIVSFDKMQEMTSSGNSLI